MKIVHKALGKSVFIPLGLTATVWEPGAGIQKKCFWIVYGNMNYFKWRNFLGISLLGNLSTGKGGIQAGGGVIATSRERCAIRAGQNF